MNDNRDIVYLSTEVYPMGTDPQYIIRDGGRYFVVYAHVYFEDDSEYLEQVAETFDRSEEVEARRVDTRSRLKYLVGPGEPPDDN